MGYLPEITLVGYGEKRDVMPLPEIVGTNIYAGKKNSLIVMDNLNTVVVNNNMRQIMAKVPGIHIWESDGSGIQIGIAARGLSPNRSWEFNIRQNGCDIAADPYGYPEAYYNPQMQAVQRIQVVRGAGALQYGPQFGGMVNYIMRDGSDIRKPLQIESSQTIGSFGLFNSFNAIGGKKGKLHYYAFHDVRRADGYRQNSAYKTRTSYGSVTWNIKQGMKVNAEYMNYDMLSQQPGGLTDAKFAENPKLSSRSRNWFTTPWQTASVKFDWEINKNNRIQVRTNANLGDRKSVGFLAAITVNDTINKLTGEYNKRELAIDYYRNYSSEAGFLHDYNLMGKKQTLSVGLRYFNGTTTRLQKGVATTGYDPNFELATGEYPVSVKFHSINKAAYLENAFRIGKRLVVIPGLRAENITVQGSGRLSFASNGSENKMIEEKRTRTFVLGGIGAEYHLGKNSHNEFYANITQAYRPILFSNVQNPGTDTTDSNLKDSKGWNADFGFRGTIAKYFHIDAGVYYLSYQNKIGSINKLNSNGQSYKYTTNLGNSFSYGLESVVDMDILSGLNQKLAGRMGSFPLFVSYNYNVSEYLDYKLISVSNGKEVVTNLKGKSVEYAPKHVLRAGLSYKYRALMLTFQASHTASVYADAANTLEASANGQNGIIPSYTIYDVMGSYRINDRFQIKMSVNNAANSKYFTRRSGGYPGPGLLPSDGRSVLASLSIVL